MRKVLFLFTFILLGIFITSCTIPSGDDISSKDKYTITFVTSVGTMKNEQYSKGDNILFSMPTLSLEELEEYNFIGWFTGENGTGIKVLRISETDTGDKVFYAHFEKINKEVVKKVTLVSSFGEFTLISYVVGTTTILPIPDARLTSDYTFKGWYDSDEYINKVTSIEPSCNTDLVFYAYWEKNDDYETSSLDDALDNIISYEYLLNYTDDRYDELYEYEQTFEFDDYSLRYGEEYDGVTYYSYLKALDNGKYEFIYSEDNENFLSVSSLSSDYIWYVKNIHFVYLDMIDSSKYILNNNVYECLPEFINEEATAMLDLDLESDTYTYLGIRVIDNVISEINISLDSIDDNGSAYHASYNILFDRFNEVSITFPENVKDVQDGYNSIEDVVNGIDGTTYSIKGSVCGYVGNNIYISDGDYGIYVYNKKQTYFEVGDVVSVTGVRDTYNGLVELTDIVEITPYDETKIITPHSLTSLEELDRYMSMPISFYNLVVVEPLSNSTPSSSSDASMVVTDGVNQTTLFISKHLPLELKNAWYEVLGSLKSGDMFTINEATVSCYKQIQICLTTNSSLKKGYTEGDEVIVTYIKVSTESLDVVYGTSLEEAMTKISIFKCFNNGTHSMLEESEYSYDSPSYLQYVPGLYEVVINYDKFTKKISIHVKAEIKEAYTPTDMKLLYDVVKDAECIDVSPSLGDVKALVIPIAFPDYKATDAMKKDIELVFNGSSEDTGWESLQSYYLKSSYGKLNISSTVLDPYLCEHNSTYYNDLYDGDSFFPDALILKEALAYYDSMINYNEYDSDNNGIIDALYLIYTAPVDYDSNDAFYWAYTSYFEEDVSFDNQTPGYYFFAGYEFLLETPASGASLVVNAETFVHETGHILGLTDYYDYDVSTGPKGGLGGGDMMDYNVGDHCPFSKVILGWTNPLVATGVDQTFTFSSFGKEGECLIIPKDWTNSYFDEYYIIDFYTPDGLNEMEKGHHGLFSKSGIRIYHVDASLSASEKIDPWYIYKKDNSNTNNKLISLVEADNAGDIEKYNDSSSNSDLFQANDIFSWAIWNDGSDASFTITVLSIGTVATFSVDFK